MEENETSQKNLEPPKVVDVSQIKNKHDLEVAYAQLKKQYKEIIKAVPSIAREAIKRGYREQVGKIDKKCEELIEARKQRHNEKNKDMRGIEQRDSRAKKSIEKRASARNQASRDWQQKHATRSDIVTGAVEKIATNATERKTKIAMGAIKVSTLAARGARLFGAKNLAREIQGRGTTYARALLTKDSKMESFARTMAESGFAAKDKVVQTIDSAKKYLEARKQAKEQDMNNIDSKAFDARNDVETDIYNRNEAAKNWKQKHATRSDRVTGVVDEISQNTTERKSRLAFGTIKVTTLAAKGARLFGAKGLAKAIQTRGTTYAHALFTKDSRMESFARTMAENGFIAADAVRGTVSHAKEKAGEYFRSGVDTAKKGAIAIGRAAVMPAAAIGALGAITLDAAASGVQKVGQGVQNVGQGVQEASKAVADKVNDVKINARVGFWGKVTGLVDKVKGMAESHLEAAVASKDKIKAQEEEQKKAAHKKDTQKGDEGR